MEFNSFLNNSMPADQLAPLNDLVMQIMSIDNSALTKENVDIMKGVINGGFTDNVKNTALQSVLQTLKDKNMTRNQVKEGRENLVNAIQEFIDSLNTTNEKQEILKEVFNPFIEIYDKAIDQYHSYDIILPMKLDAGAKVPSYAHETDSCADLYALETTTIQPHTYGNKIRTGIHLGLPEGWQARIAPRSSTGTKTPLRLSNSIGIIDCDYTGDITIIFDNISDSEYTINAGDRIAQMWVEPIYKFKPKIINKLQQTERADGGFGSTGI